MHDIMQMRMAFWKHLFFGNFVEGGPNFISGGASDGLDPALRGAGHWCRAKKSNNSGCNNFNRCCFQRWL